MLKGLGTVHFLTATQYRLPVSVLEIQCRYTMVPLFGKTFILMKQIGPNLPISTFILLLLLCLEILHHTEQNKLLSAL